jgi:hypothetical protein
MPSLKTEYWLLTTVFRAQASEETPEKIPAGLPKHTARYINSMVESGILHDVPDGSAGTGLGIVRTVDEPLDA